MLEFYQAYADYNDLMDLTEDMLRMSDRDSFRIATPCQYQGDEVRFGKTVSRISDGGFLAFNKR